MQTLKRANIAPGWTHMVGNSDGILFYNSEDGSGLVMQIDEDGQLITTSTYGPGQPAQFSANSTHVVSISTSQLRTSWRRMRGFSDPLSARPGETIKFRTSTAASAFTITYTRFNNNKDNTLPPPDAGIRSALMNGLDLLEENLTEPFTVPGQYQFTGFGPAEGCRQWSTTFSFEVPQDWASGIYTAKCADSEGSEYHIPFIVNPPAGSHSRLMIITNCLTWCAYNPWGGYSRYEIGVHDAALDFSLLRPNFRLFFQDQNPPQSKYDLDRVYNSGHLLRAELWVINWLREQGYTVDCYTDVQFHAGIDDLNEYSAIILNTHPEYWSITMLKSLMGYLDAGGKLLYLGGNGIFDCVDVSNDPLQITAYSTGDKRRTHLFRQNGIPEAAVLGIAYQFDPKFDPPDHSNDPEEDKNKGRDSLTVDVRTAYWVEGDPTHRFLAGTGLAAGDKFGEQGWNGPASGWEVDIYIEGVSPGSVKIIARGRNEEYDIPQKDYYYSAHLAYYDHPDGGWVLSAGSLTFGGSLAVDSTIQRIVKNALDECLS